jgi:undecaprenol kinase
LPASSDRPRKKRRRPVLPRERKPRTLLEYFALMGTTSKYAIAGITHTFRTQRNMRNHCIACIGAVLLGLLTGLSPLEWVAIVLAIGLVIAAELMNTAVEATVDLVTEEWHDLARIAKDAAAGAVLLSAIAAAITALLVFLPKWLA